MSLQKHNEAQLQWNKKKSILIRQIFDTSYSSRYAPIEKTKSVIKKPTIVLPIIQKKNGIQRQNQSVQQKYGIVLKLKSRHFAPHGASKALNFNMIKAKRGSEALKLNNYSFSSYKQNQIKDIDINYSFLNRIDIVSCTLLESIYYG